MKRLLMVSVGLIALLGSIGCKITIPDAPVTFSIDDQAIIGCESFTLILDTTSIAIEGGILPPLGGPSIEALELPESPLKVRATDGNGNVIYNEYIEESDFYPGDFPYAYFTFFYNQAPQADPITVQFYISDEFVPDEVVVGDFVLVTYVGACELVTDDYQKIGQIQVNAPGTRLYQAPAGDVVRDGEFNEIWLPNQSSDNPDMDVYDVLDQELIGSTTWVQIFVGNAAKAGWVPVGGSVTVLSLAD